MYEIYGEKVCGQKQPECLTKIPLFSWRLKSDEEDTEQAGWIIRVFDDNHHCIWKGGSEGASTHAIPYAGPALKSGCSYTWSVESQSGEGEIAVSTEHRFTTGLLHQEDWKARWIEPDIEPCPDDDCKERGPIMSGQILPRERPEETMNPAIEFRKEIFLHKKVKKARLFATAHGIYEIQINGQAFGYPLAPGYTSYKGYQEYQAYDAADALHAGENTIGAFVADGWYRGKMGLLGIGNQYGNQIALLMQIHVLYEDGSVEIFGTDEDFRAAKSEFIYADLFVGEGYDARKRAVRDWKTVHTAEIGYSHLRGSADQPPAFVREHEPAGIFYAPNGELIVDAGETIAGVISVRARGKEGKRISFEHSEILNTDGNFLQNIIGQNKNQTDVYIPCRDGEFFYTPRFTYHGFQYVRICGLEKEDIEEIRIRILASDLERTGQFSCSNPLINQLMKNVFRSQQSNMLYIPTDCPQREKSGFTGDTQIYSQTAAVLADVEAFLGKWLDNLRVDQYPDGQVPNTVPDLPTNDVVTAAVGEHSSAAWGDACIIVPYRLYRAYGDAGILKENYQTMKKWMAYVEKCAAEGIPEGADVSSFQKREYQKYLWNTGIHYGDWLIPSLSREGISNPRVGANMTKELVAPASFELSCDLMAQIAQILDREEDRKHYTDLKKKIKEAYAAVYLDENGRLPIDYQGMYVLALQMDLVPEEKKPLVIKRLVELIHANGDCLDTGFVSMPFLLDTLYENGQKELAYTLLYQEKCPSWLYEVKQGANTIWESWFNIHEDGSRNNSSFNHFAFGCVADFIYRRILGLQILESGYRKVRICPDTECGMEWVKGSYESVYGKIGISWSRKEGKETLDLELPPGVRAEVIFAGKTEERGSGSWHFD